MRTFGLFVEIGRLCYIARGKDQGKLCTIVNVIDGSHALVEGPDVRRRSCHFNRLVLTRLRMKMSHQDKTPTVLRKWKEQEMDKQWEATSWARRLRALKARKEMTDLDRYKLMKARRSRNRMVREEITRLRKAANGKAPQKAEKKAKKKTAKTKQL